MGTIIAAEGLRHYLRLAAPATRYILAVIVAHQAIAILLVIALEEVGVPLPLPGDVFIMFAGHLVAGGHLSLVAAFLAVVIGSMVGASVLYLLARRYGQPFIRRYGPYMHISARRFSRAEGLFRRWGPVVIIVGRHVPGFRMLISALAGVLGVGYPVFLASVAVSSAMWAAMFLAIGIRLDRHIGPYMTITPAHLLPSTLVMTLTFVYGVVLRRRARNAERRLNASSPLNGELGASVASL